MYDCNLYQTKTWQTCQKIIDGCNEWWAVEVSPGRRREQVDLVGLLLHTLPASGLNTRAWPRLQQNPAWYHAGESIETVATRQGAQGGGEASSYLPTNRGGQGQGPRQRGGLTRWPLTLSQTRHLPARSAPRWGYGHHSRQSEGGRGEAFLSEAVCPAAAASNAAAPLQIFCCSSRRKRRRGQSRGPASPTDRPSWPVWCVRGRLLLLFLSPFSPAAHMRHITVEKATHIQAEKGRKEAPTDMDRPGHPD